MNKENKRNIVLNKYISKSEQETKLKSRNILDEIIYLNNFKDLNIILKGNLGAGKTKFVEGVLKIFGKENEISSPTFTIVNEYEIDEIQNFLESLENYKKDKLKIEFEKIKINHFDVYRLEDEDEFIDSGLEEYFIKSENVLNINFIEWGENILNIIPKPIFQIEIKRYIELEETEKEEVNKEIKKIYSNKDLSEDEILDLRIIEVQKIN